jgi:hypothetical protein
MVSVPIILMASALLSTHPTAPTRTQEDAFTRALLTGIPANVLQTVGTDASPAARALRAAVLTLAGDVHAVGMRDGIPAPLPAPMIPPLAAVVAKRGAMVFVATSSARLRAGARANADVLALLPIATPLEIIEVRQGFARVRVGRRTVMWRPGPRVAELVVPQKFPAMKEDAGIEALTGFVALAVLDGAVVPHRQLLTDGRLSLERGDAPRAAVLLSRAAAHDPFDLVAREALIRAALRSGDAGLAAQTGLVTSDIAAGVDDGPEDQHWPSAQLSLALGCRGDLTRAALVDERAAPVPKDACLVNIDPRDACPPRDGRQDPASATDEEDAAFERELINRIHAHHDAVQARRRALDVQRSTLKSGPVAIVDLVRASVELPPLWWTRARVRAVTAGCGADQAVLEPPETLRLRLPRSTDGEAALRIVIVLEELTGVAYALEASPPGASAITSSLASAPDLMFTDEAVSDGSVFMWGARGVSGPPRPEKSDGILPVVRVAAPSFCEVNTCVP